MKDRIKGIFRPYYCFLKGKLLWLSDIYNYYNEQKLTAVQKEFMSRLSVFRTGAGKTSENGIVLAQMVKDYEYAIKLAASSKVFAEKDNLSVVFYDVNWTNWLGWESNTTTLHRHLVMPAIEKIFKVFGNGVVFRTGEKFHNQDFIRQELLRLSAQIETRKDVLGLKFETVLVGDLIYDTYLRYFHKTTIESIDKDVLLILEIALNIYYNFKYFLKNNKVKCLLNTYSVYIEHGLPARICLDQNIDTYTIASHTYVIQKLTKEFPYHLINHSQFNSEKELTGQQLKFAEEEFVKRFKGKIDVATNYMRQSAYTDAAVPSELRKIFLQQPRNIVIYAHDFYDSPHTHRLLQCPDFYQWLKEILLGLTGLQSTNIFVRIHPNGLPGCKEQVIDIVNIYNAQHFHIIDESVSNLSIVELKPDLIATARGTIGIEMAWFGIPVVALYDNLYANFKFVHTCTTKEEYFAILQGKQQPQIDFDKNEIYSFYYQAFLEQAPITSRAFNLLKSFNGDTYNDRYLEFVNTEAEEIFSEQFIKYYRDLI